jgi:hypothetical protein
MRKFKVLERPRLWPPRPPGSGESDVAASLAVA